MRCKQQENLRYISAKEIVCSSFVIDRNDRDADKMSTTQNAFRN